MLAKYLVSRIFNQLRCWFSYALSLFGVVRVHHLPTFVSIEPANCCQLRCPECPVGRRHKERYAKGNKLMTMELFERVLQQVQNSVHTVQFYFQGEPLLNPQLSKMIARAREVGLFTIVSTNAQALTQMMAKELVRSGLNRIIVSIDGFSKDSYAAYRVGGDLHRALEGLRFLQEAKMQYHSSISIELQVLRLRTNEHEWKWISRNYKKMGATRLVMKTAQLYDYQHGHPLMPTDEHYSRYKRLSNGTYQLVRPLPISFKRHVVPCYRLWSGCVLTTDGTLVPCCYDKACEYQFGSLLQHNLKDIWHNKKADDFRRQVLKKNNTIPICRDCYF